MSITAANATIFMTIPRLYDVPQQVQQFAADDVFGSDPIAASEVMRGVDGKLSGGFVYANIRQTFALMADSPSVDLFDNWYLAQVAQRDSFEANMVITLISLGKKYNMTKGFLVGYPPLSEAKRLLQPRRFAIEWESITPAAT